MNPSSLYQVIWQVRRTFQRLRAASEAMLEQTGINTSQRAVLEFVQRSAPHTVSGIAQKMSVSRQHIQVLVNGLQEAGLVTTEENPAHKRSPLIIPTTAGSVLFRKIHDQEKALLDSLSSSFAVNDLRTTLHTLEKLDSLLTGPPDEYESVQTDCNASSGQTRK